MSNNDPDFKPPPDAPILILTMQMTFIAENVAIILNMLLIFTFIYQVKKERTKISKEWNKGVSRSHSSTAPSPPSPKQKGVNNQSIHMTFLLLTIGFIFSICQGLIENWLTNDCGAAWLQWLTFFFYVFHRELLLLSFLHRLKFVFRDSAYAYPDCFYYTLLILIIMHFVASFIIYGMDHAVTYVNIKMYTGFSGNILCSWSMGYLISFISRPIEIVLMLILVAAFLYKLWQIHTEFTKYIVNDGSNAPQIQKTSKLLIIFRKITFLTLSAIATTIVIQFGYISFKPFAFALSLDAVFNSFCVFLMFQFNQIFIKQCFGYKCDRLCCIEFQGGTCKCHIINCFEFSSCCNTSMSVPPISSATASGDIQLNVVQKDNQTNDN